MIQYHNNQNNIHQFVDILLAKQEDTVRLFRHPKFDYYLTNLNVCILFSRKFMRVKYSSLYERIYSITKCLKESDVIHSQRLQ